MSEPSVNSKASIGVPSWERPVTSNRAVALAGRTVAHQRTQRGLQFSVGRVAVAPGCETGGAIDDRWRRKACRDTGVTG